MEASGHVGTASESEKTKIGSVTTSAGRARTISSIAEVKIKRSAFLEDGRGRTDAAGHVQWELVEITKISK